MVSACSGDPERASEPQAEAAQEALRALGKQAEKNLLPIQPGDVPATFANVDDLIRDVGFKPATPIETGVQKFVDWYRDFYKV